MTGQEAAVVVTTYGLIDVPSRKLVIIDADMIDAEIWERLAGVAIVANVAGPIARVTAEVFVSNDAAADERLDAGAIDDGDCCTLTIDVLRWDDAT